MSVINTNITSMIGQSNLSKSQNALQTSMERLSSGLRINSAKDDAAGQAIANRMSSQITGLSQAQRNANDGISVAQTAEGALNQVNDNLQRIRELTVQSQNATNSSDDRQSIQDEINQRLEEIDRISKETSFNGVNVLASDQRLKIQVGANDGEAITVNLQEINSKSLNLDSFNVNGQVRNATATASELNAAGFVQNSEGAFVGAENMSAKLADLEALVESGDLAALTGTTNEFATATVNAAASIDNFVAEAHTANSTITVGSDAYVSDGAKFTTTDTYSSDASAAAADLLSDLDVPTGGQVAISGSNLGDAAFVDESGNLFQSDGTTAATIADLDALMATADAEVTVGDITYTVSNDTNTVTRTQDYNDTQMAAVIADSNSTVTSDFGYQVNEFGAVKADGGESAFYDATGTSLTTSDGGRADNATVYTVTNGTVTQTTYNGPLGTDIVGEADQRTYVDADSGDLTTETGGERTYYAITDEDGSVVEYNTAADGSGETAYVDENGAYTRDEFTADADAVSANPLAALDDALKQVDSLRSELGAVQNRFESAITNLQTNETNLSAARSRIEDADYATEVANMTRAQILQQAGTSVLAQANQIPQNVLSLLG